MDLSIQERVGEFSEELNDQYRINKEFSEELNDQYRINKEFSEELNDQYRINKDSDLGSRFIIWFVSGEFL